MTRSYTWILLLFGVTLVGTFLMMFTLTPRDIAVSESDASTIVASLQACGEVATDTPGYDIFSDPELLNYCSITLYGFPIVDSAAL